MRSILFFSILIFSFSSHAENYFKTTLGYSVSGRISAELTADGYTGEIVETFNLRPNFLNPVAIAYGHDLDSNYFIELEIMFGAYKPSTDVNQDVSYIGIGLNSIYQYDTETDSIVPWTGVGAVLSNFTFYDEEGLGLNAQIMFGVDFKLSDNVTIGPDIRYSFSLIKPEIESYNSDLGTDLNLEAAFRQLSANIAMKVKIF